MVDAPFTVTNDTPMEELRRMEQPDGGLLMSEVFVRWTQQGWHNWPDAPERRAYLRAPHRHLFYYEVRVVVGTNEHDRGIEFHDLLDLCKQQTTGPDLGANSCEMLALALGRVIQGYLETEGLYGPPASRGITVTVSEDNECGSTVVLG